MRDNLAANPERPGPPDPPPPGIMSPRDGRGQDGSAAPATAVSHTVCQGPGVRS